MTCDAARELCSALLDEALDASERAALDAHLATCAECRRELDDLRRTVAVLHAVERPRAPVGFVDRVIEAAQPVPWHRRLRDRLAGVRILRVPVEAAAVVVVASLAVYVFYRTPELQQAATPEAPVMAPDIKTNKTPPWVTSGSESPAPPPAPQEDRLESERRALTPPEEALRRDVDTAREKRFDDAVRARQELGTGRAKEGEVPPQQAIRLERSPRSVEGTAPAPAARSAPETPAARPPAAPAPPVPPPSGMADRTEPVSPPKAGATPSPLPAPLPTPGGSASPSVLAAPPPMATPRPPLADAPAARSAPAPPSAQAPLPLQVPSIPAPQSTAHLASKSAEPAPADVIGRLTVRDRAAVNRDLAALLASVGAVQLARREEGATTVVEVAVPRERYALFQERLERVGAWRLETNPSELPDVVRVTLRIAQ